MPRILRTTMSEVPKTPIETAKIFQRLGFQRPDANRRALLAYSTYLGYAQLVHATPQLLPQTQTARSAYLNDVLAALTSPPS
jgi:hypothetical protein